MIVLATYTYLPNDSVKKIVDDRLGYLLVGPTYLPRDYLPREQSHD